MPQVQEDGVGLLACLVDDDGMLVVLLYGIKVSRGFLYTLLLLPLLRSCPGTI